MATLRHESTYGTPSRSILAAALAQLGRLEEARIEGPLFMADYPDFVSSRSSTPSPSARRRSRAFRRRLPQGGLAGLTAFVALLRAVNVGGTGKLPMSRAQGDVRGLPASTAVRTYIASGNVVFASGKPEAAVQG